MVRFLLLKYQQYTLIIIQRVSIAVFWEINILGTIATNKVYRVVEDRQITNFCEFFLATMIWWYLSIFQAPIVLKMPQNFLNELSDLHIYLHLSSTFEVLLLFVFRKRKRGTKVSYLVCYNVQNRHFIKVIFDQEVFWIQSLQFGISLETTAFVMIPNINFIDLVGRASYGKCFAQTF